MPPSKQNDLKTRLMKEAEEVIDKMLEEKAPADQILLSEIEKAAIETGQGLQQAVVKHLAQESYKHEGEVPPCPKCERAVRFKDYRSRWLETEAGPVEVKRAYFYCKECKAGFFPPG